MFLYLAARNDSITSSAHHVFKSDAAPPVRLRAEGVLHHGDGSHLQDIRDCPWWVCEKSEWREKAEILCAKLCALQYIMQKGVLLQSIIPQPVM